MGSVEFASRRANAPDLEQQIAARLIRWGHTLDGFSLPVASKEIEIQIDNLQSPISEQRVRAADWLASHGVRSAGPDIAAAMIDPRTLRPCQLAKDLGRLGDSAWTNALIDASLQSSNRDVAACATYGLCELAVSGSIDALKENYRRNIAPIFALDALGQIADPAVTDFLRQVANKPRNPIEENAVRRALENTGIMSQRHPEIGLIEKFKAQGQGNSSNEWAIRKLSYIKSEQVVAALAEALRVCNETQNERQLSLAAALLAQGPPGKIALREIAESSPDRSSRPIIYAAVSLSMNGN